MKTTLAIALSLMFFNHTAQAEVASSEAAVVAHCEYSSVGWVKAYGADSIEFNQEIKGSSMEDLTKSCQQMAQVFADDHPEQGAVATVTVASVQKSKKSNT